MNYSAIILPTGSETERKALRTLLVLILQNDNRAPVYLHPAREPKFLRGLDDPEALGFVLVGQIPAGSLYRYPGSEITILVQNSGSGAYGTIYGIGLKEIEIPEGLTELGGPRLQAADRAAAIEGFKALGYTVTSESPVHYAMEKLFSPLLRARVFFMPENVLSIAIDL